MMSRFGVMILIVGPLVYIAFFALGLWRRAGIDAAIMGVAIPLSAAICASHLCVHVARKRSGDVGPESNIRWLMRALKKGQ